MSIHVLKRNLKTINTDISISIYKETTSSYQSSMSGVKMIDNEKKKTSLHHPVKQFGVIVVALIFFLMK